MGVSNSEVAWTPVLLPVRAQKLEFQPHSFRKAVSVSSILRRSVIAMS